jgi:hypothetical protein
MAIVGKRPRRINIDGLSNTETRLAKTALLPGSFVFINPADDNFTQALAANMILPPLYIVGRDDIIGETIDTPVVAGSTAVADYVEQGRQFAALVAATTVLKKDSPLMLHATNGTLIPYVVAAGNVIVAYSQEVYTIPAGSAALALVRIA